MAGALKDFYSKINSVRKRLGISHYPCWYRGHSHGEKYQLLPSLYRRSILPNSDEERNIFAEFVTESHRHLDREHDSWEMISVMRHFGCPTRFMDWTDSLHAALFFALLDEGASEKPCLWILHPYDLNEKATSRRMIFDRCDLVGKDYYEAISTSSWPYDFPIAMAPRWVTPRMVAQRGYFTFHGNDSRPLNEVCPGSVKRVIIDDALADDLRRELVRSRTDHRSIYPDLYGLGRYLSLKFQGSYDKS